MRTGLAMAMLLLAAQTQTWRSTRIRVLRTEEDKVRYLNNSKVLRENLFFGIRPILYVSRYSCDCPTTADPGPDQAANWDLPDFPAEDDVFPFSEQPSPPPRLQEAAGPAAPPADEPEQEDEFELLISQPRTEQHVLEPHDRPFILSFRSKPVQRRPRRRKVVRARP